MGQQHIETETAGACAKLADVVCGNPDIFGTVSDIAKYVVDEPSRTVAAFCFVSDPFLLIMQTRLLNIGILLKHFS